MINQRPSFYSVQQWQCLLDHVRSHANWLPRSRRGRRQTCRDLSGLIVELRMKLMDETSRGRTFLNFNLLSLCLSNTHTHTQKWCFAAYRSLILTSPAETLETCLSDNNYPARFRLIEVIYIKHACHHNSPAESLSRSALSQALSQVKHPPERTSYGLLCCISFSF